MAYAGQVPQRLKVLDITLHIEAKEQESMIQSLCKPHVSQVSPQVPEAPKVLRNH